jgi:hypothetical protein
MSKNVIFIGISALFVASNAYATNYSGYPVGCMTSVCGTIIRSDVNNHNEIDNKNVNANANKNVNANANANENKNVNANANKNVNANVNKNVNANANKNVNANNNKNTANSNALSKNNNVIKNDVNNASHSSADNHLDVSNDQNQDQNQKQHQAQDQTQTQSVANSGNSSLSNSGNSTNANNSSAQGNNTNVTIEGDTYQQRRIPVATAIAPNLTAGQITCLGSVTGGIQTGVVGLSGGKTIVDKNCVMITQVNTLYQMGYTKAACERMRQDPDIKAAMEAAGETCEPPVVEQPAAVDTSQFATKQEVQDTNQKLDNYIRVDRQNELK